MEIGEGGSQTCCPVGTLGGPRDVRSDAPQGLLRDCRVSPASIAQMKDLLLDVRCQVKEVHDLRHPRAGNSRAVVGLSPF